MKEKTEEKEKKEKIESLSCKCVDMIALDGYIKKTGKDISSLTKLEVEMFATY